MLNTDLGADSCGLHIVENGSIKPEERNYSLMPMLKKDMKYIQTKGLYTQLHYLLLPSLKFCLHLGVDHKK